MVITTHQKNMLKQPQKHNELPEGPITGPQNTETQVVVSLAMGGVFVMLVYFHSYHAPVLLSYIATLIKVIMHQISQ